MRRLPLLLAAALAAAAVAVAAAAPAEVGAPHPLLFLHLSDIHYSVNVRKYWASFGDREGDAALWAQQVVPRLRPAAVLVTGDITDSKTARGEGLQQEVEWLGYAGLLRNLSAAGVPLERVWDVPGNHDTFNMPLRGGPNDFFSKHAAEGRRRASPHQCVYVHQLQLPAGQPAEQQQGEGQGQGCPAWFLGMDPTPAPGLRSPTNFAGQARPAVMAEARAALQSIMAAQPAACGAPYILAYLHYPLSTVDSTDVGAATFLLHAAHTAAAMQGLTRLLAEHGVAAVLSGHLHASLGQRLHRLHPTPAGGYMAELETAAWKDDRRFRILALDGGSLAFAELMFHTRNAPRMPRRADAGAMRAPAWREAYAQRGWAVTALDPTAAVVDHAVLITSPPDGRYALLGPPQQAQQAQQQEGDAQQGQGWVRALVFPLDAAEQEARLDVMLVGFLPNGVQLFSKPMALLPANSSSGGGLLFAAQGEMTVSCVGAAGDPAAHCHAPAELATIQVSVKGTSGRASQSPRQPVALRCAALTASHQRCWVAPVEGEPLPLGSGFFEWLVLAVNWPVMIHRLFLCVWALQVGGMLIAPRLLGSRVLPLIAASPLLQYRRPERQLPATPRGAAAASGAAAAVTQALRAAASYLVWPVAALFLCASVTEVWAALLGFSLYLLLGPWLLYTALSGHPPAALFHFGVAGRLDLGGLQAADHSGSPPSWRFIGTCDTMFVSLVHMVVCVLPATLWVACVVGRRLQLQHSHLPAGVSRTSSSSSGGSNGQRRTLESGGAGSTASLLLGGCLAGGSGGGASTCSRWSFSRPQLAALAALAAWNCATIYWKAASLMGGIALLVSPGLSWVLPLALLLVVAWGGPCRSTCGPRKGE